MRESTVESAICAHAKILGCITVKMAMSGHRGIPDRLFLRRGVAAFLEVKAPGRRPTELQLRYIRELNSQGFAASWVDNIADGRKFLNDVFP